MEALAAKNNLWPQTQVEKCQKMSCNKPVCSGNPHSISQYLTMSLGTNLITVLMCLCLYLCCDDDNHCINIICQVESHLIINVVHQRQGSTLILLSNYLISSPSQWDANTTSALSEPIHQLYKDFWLLVGHHKQYLYMIKNWTALKLHIWSIHN